MKRIMAEAAGLLIAALLLSMSYVAVSREGAAIFKKLFRPKTTTEGPAAPPDQSR